MYHNLPLFVALSFIFCSEGNQIVAQSFSNQNCSGAPLSTVTFLSGECVVVSTGSSDVVCSSDLTSLTLNEYTTSTCTGTTSSSYPIVSGNCNDLGGSLGSQIWRCQCDCQDCNSFSFPITKKFSYWHRSVPCPAGTQIELSYFKFVAGNDTLMQIATLDPNDFQLMQSGSPSYNYYTHYSTLEYVTCYVPDFTTLTLNLNDLYIVLWCSNSSQTCQGEYNITLSCVDGCSSYSDCSTCTAQDNCVWCQDTSTCEVGSISGPTTGVCTNYAFFSSLCDYVTPVSITPVSTPTSIVTTPTSSNPFDLVMIIGIAVGAFVVVVIVIIIGICCCRCCTSKTDHSIVALKKYFHLSKIGSSVNDPRPLPSTSEEYKKITNIFHDHLGGSGLEIEEIQAIYNKDLFTVFNIFYNNTVVRLKDSPNIFQNEKWKEQDTDGLRLWIVDRFEKYQNKFPWNNMNSDVKIVPMVHGSDYGTALKIFKTGFATLATLDAGWYGKGIYFTSSAKYAGSYYATKSEPALIIAFVIPGICYPVIEYPGLVGTAIKSPATSHYVVTTASGYPVTKPTENAYDELVIVQESQAFPAFLIRLDKKSISQVIEYLKSKSTKPEKQDERKGDRKGDRKDEPKDVPKDEPKDKHKDEPRDETKDEQSGAIESRLKDKLYLNL